MFASLSEQWHYRYGFTETTCRIVGVSAVSRDTRGAAHSYVGSNATTCYFSVSVNVTATGLTSGVQEPFGGWSGNDMPNIVGEPCDTSNSKHGAYVQKIGTLRSPPSHHRAEAADSTDSTDNVHHTAVLSAGCSRPTVCCPSVRVG